MELFAAEVLPAIREFDESNIKDPVEAFEPPPSQSVEMAR